MKLEKILIAIRFLTFILLSLIIGLNLFKIYTYEELRPILLGTIITFSIANIIILNIARKRK